MRFPWIGHVASRDFRLISRTVLVIIVGLNGGGCGSSTTKELATFPVTGLIKVNGKSPERAEIRLKPRVPLEDPKRRSVEPYAIVESDGSFQVSTYQDGDGAPPGEYAVTVIWPEITVEGGEEVYGRDRLGHAFADPRKPVVTIEVIEGENEIPNIELRY